LNDKLGRSENSAEHNKAYIKTHLSKPIKSKKNLVLSINYFFTNAD